MICVSTRFCSAEFPNIRTCMIVCSSRKHVPTALVRSASPLAIKVAITTWRTKGHEASGRCARAARWIMQPQR